MTEQDTRATVKEVMELVFNQSFDDGDPIARSETPAWDSLKHVEMVFAVEDACAVQFTRDELENFDSLDSVVGAVETRRAQS